MGTFPSQILQKRRKRRKLLMIRRGGQRKGRLRRKGERGGEEGGVQVTYSHTKPLKQQQQPPEKTYSNPIPLETLPHSLQQAKKIKTKFKKICTNSYTLAHSTSFPNDIVPPRSRSVIRTE